MDAADEKQIDRLIDLMAELERMEIAARAARLEVEERAATLWREMGQT